MSSIVRGVMLRANLISGGFNMVRPVGRWLGRGNLTVEDKTCGVVSLVVAVVTGVVATVVVVGGIGGLVRKLG